MFETGSNKCDGEVFLLIIIEVVGGTAAMHVLSPYMNYFCA
jgi:hypothetical protein